MKLKHILLVASAALTLSLVSVEIALPEDPGSKPGIGSGANGTIAGGNAGANGGDLHTIAGRKPGAAAGSGS